ncbi:MAG TPA: NADH-ubiquinone oxidoreductase-F iron-sulfur binding region domain-containing protein [Acidimicrobiia bacterium]|nr:NADH-ubiquinone oxidoreductase-F iron-sulfur binding region domain-containing protein [Acidimicrobiia bacterium]
MTGAPDVASFSHLVGIEPGTQPCQGLACFVARREQPARWQQTLETTPRVHCLGRCYEAPVTGEGSSRPHVESIASRTVVLERMRAGPVRTVEAYRRHGGLAAVERALSMPRPAVVAAIEASAVRGRGGAGFPAGRKWRAVLEQPDETKFVVCNADEGDPGAYIDRFLLEDDPFCVLEAMLIAAYAVGAQTGYVYVRREYPHAFRSVTQAVERLRSLGVLGADARGRGSGFDVRVLRGKGSYVCGEETALLNAIEGRRPEVRARPPFPSAHGLFGHPTLVHNVETLANVPWILREGPDAYAALGRGNSRGTKVLSLNSRFRRPGLYEVELGTPLARVLFDAAGGVRGGALSGVLVGGPLAGVIPPRHFDVPLAFEDLEGIGASLGHGGVVAFGGDTSIVDLAHHVFRFGRDESCGKCTPCRVGSVTVERTLAAWADGDPPSGVAREELPRVVDALAAASLCGHGTGLAAFARSLSRHYPDEVDACFG